MGREYPEFIYHNFSWRVSNRGLLINFEFEIGPDFRFKPKVLLVGATKAQVKRVGQGTLNNLVFHLGLIEALSYWKTTCSPNFVVRAGFLSRGQIRWWQELIKKGLAQFFYENDIRPFAPRISTQTNSCRKSTIVDFLQEPDIAKNRHEKVLIPIGGGKDSIVTLEILKQQSRETVAFVLNPGTIAKNIIRAAGIKNAIFVKRQIDPLLFKLNKLGFLNGHTPFTAYLSFLSLLAAALFGVKNIAFSNESSANEANLKWRNLWVNHQWSKSREFEKMFREYVKKYLTAKINYFSFLRPLSELQIAKLFSHLPKYWQVFVSCNKPFRMGNYKLQNRNWCCRCPKCLSTFLLLSPFIDRSKLVKIFDRDLLADKALLPTFLALLGVRAVKPFECVAAEKEMRAAAYLTLKKQGAEERPFLLDYFEKRLLPKYPNIGNEARSVLAAFDKKNFLPSHLAALLKNLPKSTICAYAFFADRAIILGLGREGESTLAVIRQCLPDKKVAIADQTPLAELPKNAQNLIKKDRNLILHLGPNYLKALPQYQLIIRTPGIPWKIIRPHLKPKHIVTSQSELFFEDFPGTIVGITGTKGKSTTASLIYHILKKAGKKVLLAGNIGQPPLSALKIEIRRDRIPAHTAMAVMELSSHQLYGLRKSPHIAVLLNVYPEHLDYYRSFREYWQAKANLVRFQSADDFLVFNGANQLTKKIARLSRATKIPFQPKREQSTEGQTLLKTALGGLSPQSLTRVQPESIAAALAVAKILKIPDSALKKALATFQPLAHRLERVGEYQGITFYNDSLATIPEATLRAMAKLGNTVQTLILGGFERGAAFERLAKAICRSEIQTLILLPESGKRIWKAVQKKCPRRKKRFFANNMAEAVKSAYRRTAPGKICLLSPAAPSFGLFKDYAQRGDLFKNYVKRFSR